MAVNSGVVTVGTTATALNTDDDPAGVNRGNSVLVRNPGPATLYIGGADVTTDSAPSTGGYPLAAGEVIAVAALGGEHVYGRVASGTVAVNVLRQGVA